MPSNSTLLSQEGAAIVSFKLVSNGLFQEEKIRSILSESRNIRDNISDLKAAIAANNRGIKLVHDLIGEYGLAVVVEYMKYIRA